MEPWGLPYQGSLQGVTQKWPFGQGPLGLGPAAGAGKRPQAGG